MRIIAGAKRGMKLLSPKTIDTRPITDRVKESVFSILYKYGIIEGGIIADLFCGTGSLGLEALSRGAKYVVFVEKSRPVVEILKKNITRAGFAANSKVLTADAFKTAAPFDVSPDANPIHYDLVFVDPPYKLSTDTSQDSSLGRLLHQLNTRLSNDALVLVRTHKTVDLQPAYGTLSVIDRRKWGNMAVTFLQELKEDTA